MKHWKGALVAGLAWTIATTAAASFAETYVEPHFKDCSGTPQTIRPHVYGSNSGTGNGLDVDNDARYEGSSNGGTTEDTDGDAIFETIDAAVDNTSTGGIVHIVVPGLYREKVTIPDSMTIRGAASGGVILEGTCLATNGKALEVTGSSKTVFLENLTIVGYDYGVYATDSAVNVNNCAIRGCDTGIYVSGAELNVTRSTIQGCLYGIEAPSSAYEMHVTDTEIADVTNGGISGSSGAWHVTRCVIRNCSRGIDMNGSSGTNVLLVNESRIYNNANEGIRCTITSSFCQLSVHASEVSANAGDGISYSGRPAGVRVTDSLVEANGDDGILIENNYGCVADPPTTQKLQSVVEGTRILGNVGDGIEAKGTGTCSFPNTNAVSLVAVFQNTIALNGGYGIRTTTGGGTYCKLGRNQIAYNVTGAENAGTAACTGDTTTLNQVP